MINPELRRNDRLRTYEIDDVKGVVQQPQMEFLDRCEAYLSDCEFRGGLPLHFRIETFTITQATTKKGAEHSAMHVIGTLQYFLHKYETWCEGNVSVSYSKPSDVMKLFPDDVLKSLGLHTPGRGHANDAARHAAHYMLDDGLIGYSDMYPDTRDGI